ncbi:MAG: dihydropyrimidine dehydrogenase [Halolamina sp.]
MTPALDPPVALASLSGEADAEWAAAGAPWAGCAVLGGVAVDDPSRAAARRMVADRDRSEFLPPDPLAFVAAQLDAAADLPLRPAVNVRATGPEPIRAVAEVCADRGAMVEINAHCRQAELCAAGCGERLLADTDRLRAQVGAAAETGATVSVKLRAEVEGVDLAATARTLTDAGASVLHVDAMDSEPVVADVVEAAAAESAGDAAARPLVVANNGVRDEATVREYARHGADAVSVGRPSDDPEVLAQVAAAARAHLPGDPAATASPPESEVQP